MDSPVIGILAAPGDALASRLAATLAGPSHGLAVQALDYATMAMAVPPGATVILDMASSAAPALASALKNAALCGAQVIDDPFWALCRDRHLDAQLAAAAGVDVPRMALLPNHSHVEGVVPESLRNRAPELDWQGVTDWLGWPVVYKPARAGVRRRAAVAWDLAGLVALWEAGGQEQFVLQAFVEAPSWVRVLVIGKEALALEWDPVTGHALGDATGPAAATAAVMGLTAARAIGTQWDAFDFALHEGRPWAVDLHTPGAGLDPARIGNDAFGWAVTKAADLLAAAARSGDRPTYRWDGLKP